MRDNDLLPTKNKVSKVGDESGKLRDFSQEGPVAKVARQLGRAEVRPMGLFRHPSDFNEEERAIIVTGLRGNVPLYRLASRVNCERHMLARYIDKDPDLRQLKENQKENLYDEAVFQADRLMQAGNASMVIFALQTLGRKKGWSTEDFEEDEGNDKGRIVMGLIPDNEVDEAQRAAEAMKEPGETAAAMPPAAADPLGAELAVESAVNDAESGKRLAEMDKRRRDNADRAAGRLVDVDEGGRVVSGEEFEGNGVGDGYGYGQGYGGEYGGEYGGDFGGMGDMPPDTGESMFFR